MQMIWTIEISNHSETINVFLFSTKQKALDYVKENIHKHSGLYCHLQSRSIDNPEVEFEDWSDSTLLVENWHQCHGEPAVWHY